MASVGTVTVNVRVGEDLEAAIRKIVRDEIEVIAQRAADNEAGCPVAGCSAFVPLYTLAEAARWVQV